MEKLASGFDCFHSCFRGDHSLCVASRRLYPNWAVMVGVPENAFFQTLLRPIACITSGCRPSGRKSSHAESCSIKPVHRLSGETSAQALDQPQDRQACSRPLDDRKRLLQGSERERVELNQLECCFLKLPIEVRLMVYHYVLCVPVPIVHIVRRKDGSLCHVRCRASKGECGTYRCYNDYSELSRTTKNGSTPGEGRFSYSGGLLSLAFTCKKMSVYKLFVITLYF